ncbi:hypothetical protein PLESTM_002074800 [Pleodorina starrii]|nr:hypothetical protein PLESTM_002074800 [Pleodorina starrii]
MEASKGVVRLYDHNGIIRECREVLGAFLADLQEQWDAISLAHYPASRCDVATLATREDFIKPDAAPAARTEEMMCKVTAVALDLEAGKQRGWKTTYDNLCRGFGFHPNEVALWGFHGTDIYSCVAADTLHQCFNGMTKHLFACLLDYINENCRDHKESVVCILHDRLSSYRRLHYGGRIPANSLWAIKTCGEENEAIMRFIGIALYGLMEFGVADEVVELFVKYARYVQLRDTHVHTTGSMRMLEDLVAGLQGDILKVFPTKNWDFPKFFHMRKYAADVRMYGMTDLTTTGPKESLVKDNRKAWMNTNKKNDTYNQQGRQRTEGEQRGDVADTSAARAFRPCLAAFMKEQWQDIAPVELDEATIELRRVVALFYEPYGTSNLI